MVVWVSFGLGWFAGVSATIAVKLLMGRFVDKCHELWGDVRVDRMEIPALKTTVHLAQTASMIYEDVARKIDDPSGSPKKPPG
jgi:hypothetical protein